ncbi:winged helix-turn-helix domain-containing protein [Pseudoalteromonas phenolica]|uniref:winged helix-turn-helix domain-containing protein n=1 Tax=Pseudoalteromonas phenolica TaxID=161398 RepID=UPI0013EEE847|nr:winged helix-turn-helix domain-containing protein [Pseudoalteromonas phenolica]
MQYQTLGYLINPHALTLQSIAGEAIAIRPKTCQLLLLLIENAGSPVSKQHILETVWADSVVAEQVVFQSINELRQIFTNQEVIKTIPKQGYVWLPDVSMFATPEPNHKTNRHTITVIICSLVIAFAVLLYYFSLKPHEQSKPNTVAGSIVILPTHNQIEGNDHSWVRLGLMDQVIQRLPNNQAHGVLQTDYVLEVLERADAPLNNVKPEHIKQIFTVSGAELIVSSKLSGTPHDYQLSYTLHYRNTLQKGVLFGRNIQDVIDKFSDKVAKQLGEESSLQASNYHADFNDEMLGVAIDLTLEDNHLAAKPLLESIIAHDPENLTAQRLLINTLFDLKDYPAVNKHLMQAIPLAQKLNDKNELSRLHYLNAIHAIIEGDDELAKPRVEQALQVAQRNHDWLFMAYSKDLLARIAQHQGEYELAKTYYLEAKKHHQVLRCPVGESSVWASLALLAKKQNKLDEFNTSLNKAKQIAKSRALTNQLKYLNTLNY